MVLPLFSPPGYICAIAGPEEAKNLGGGERLRLIQIRLAAPSLEKISKRVNPRIIASDTIRVIRESLRTSLLAKFAVRARSPRIPLHRPRHCGDLRFLD